MRLDLCIAMIWSLCNDARSDQRKYNTESDSKNLHLGEGEPN